MTEVRNELSAARSKSLRSSGNKATTKLMKEVTDDSPNCADKILSTWKSSKQNDHRKYTPEKALSLLIGNNFTKSPHVSMCRVAKSDNCNIYPNYKQLLTAKTDAYPSDIYVDDKKCEVSLQSPLNNTCERLLQLLPLPEEDISVH